jgi:hypothetical protein
MRKFFFFIFIGTSLTVLAQEEPKSALKLSENVSVQLGGFARVDAFYDSRRNYDAIDGGVVLFPKERSYDAYNNDMNAAASANVTAIATRFWARFSGPDVLGARTSSHFEFDFTGNSDPSFPASVRFRQGWIKMTWPMHEILVGRTWHPLFVTTAMPPVLGLAAGAPFNPFNRSDQIRYSFKPGSFTFSAVAAYQGDYTSYGNEAGAVKKSSMFQRRAVVPDLSLVAEYSADGVTVGAVGNYKQLLPAESLLVDGTTNKIKTDVKVESYSALAYAKYKQGLFTATLNGLLAQNLAESLIPGGYAQYKARTVNQKEAYTSSNHVSSWISFTYGKEHEIGIFAGYLKNLGTTEAVVLKTATNSAIFYGRSGNIDNIWRIAPHYTFTSGRFQFSPEVEYTVATYGTPDCNDHMKIKDTYTVNNTRLLLVAVYNF